MKYLAQSLLLFPLFISCSEINDDANNDLVRDNEKPVIVKDSSSTIPDFNFEVQVIERNIVYQKVSSFQVGNSNDPNYGDLSLFGAFRLVPYTGEEFNKKYTIDDIVEYLDKSLYIYPDSTNYSGNAPDLTVNILPFTSAVTFSELKLQSDPTNIGTSIGSATFTGIAKSMVKIPIDDVAYINTLLKASQTDSTDKVKDFFRYHNGFMIKASSPSTNRSQSFYAYGVASGYQPELKVKVRVIKNGIADTVSATFGIESANQLSTFTRSANWDITNTDSIKYVSYSGQRLKIKFDAAKFFQKPVSVYNAELKLKYSGSTSFGNLGYFTFYGSNSDSTLLTPLSYSNTAEKGFFKFNMSSWLQAWNINSTINHGFYILNADDATSVSHITFYLNDTDSAKKAKITVLYSERQGVK